MNVHTISLGFVQSYLLETSGGLVLIDCGTPGQEKTILKYIQSLKGSDLKLIYITHAHSDHFGAAAALKQATGALIAAHRIDAEIMAGGKSPVQTKNPWLGFIMNLASHLSPVQPTPADILLDDGQRLDEYGLPGVVYHTPGHTPGSSCLLLDDGTLFAGDLFSARGPAHLQHKIIADTEALKNTYRRLRTFNASQVYVGHSKRPLSGVEMKAAIDAELELL